MKRLIVWAGALGLTLLCTAPLLAGARATLLLKSGNRVGGDLVDMGGSGFTMMVNGQKQRFGTGDVAVIDFHGNAGNLPNSEVARAADGRGVAVLQGGRVIEGQLYDVGGTSPLRLTFNTPSGRVDYTSNDVLRIYLSAVPGRESTTGATTLPARPGEMTVPGNRQWMPTGIYVNQGDRVSFNATGEIRLSDDPNDIATPYGSTSRRYAQRAPMPRVLAGALIGRIGNSDPFGIGNPTGPLTMPASGELYLGVNDDVVSDNRGEFRVDVQGGSSRVRRR
jgi:hypothetical protein